MSSTFQKRLNRACKTGDLTIFDLHSWFERPYATVWRWAKSGWVPRGPNGRRAERDLTTLEKLVAAGKVFPIPFYIGSRHRRGYVRDAYHAASRLPPARAAK